MNEELFNRSIFTLGTAVKAGMSSAIEYNTQAEVGSLYIIKAGEEPGSHTRTNSNED